VPLAKLVLRDTRGQPLPLSAYKQRGAQVLVLRVMTSWCGPCRWQAEHTRSLLPEGAQARVAVLDVLVAGQDNAEPQPADLAAWSERVQTAAAVASDADFQLSPLFAARAALPLIALVDLPTFALRSTLSAPSPEMLTAAIAAALAQPTKTADAQLHDGRFTRDVWDMIRATRLAAAPDPSNAYADHPGASALGR
jgi:thiol-disulfide isomerase/thioredoxin